MKDNIIIFLLFSLLFIGIFFIVDSQNVNLNKNSTASIFESEEIEYDVAPIREDSIVHTDLVESCSEVGDLVVDLIVDGHLWAARLLLTLYSDCKLLQ